MISENEIPESVPEGSGRNDFHAEPYEDDPVIVPLVTRKGIERNDQCPCNSGKKYKKCHIKADKGLLPQELRAVMHKLLTITQGIGVKQEALDEYPKDAVMNVMYDEKRQAWRIVPKVEQKLDLLVPKSRIIRPGMN